MSDSFCAFILSHGRPGNVLTYKTLERHGYTGKIYIVIDNEDDAAKDYYKEFGDKVIMFDKKAISKKFDEGDNFNDRRSIVYARNACFEIAKELGIKYFIQLDDDYYWFGYRTTSGAKSMRQIDNVFSILVKFLEETYVTSIAFSQGGDHIGGYDETKKISRKAMNSFVCKTDRPFKFFGRINEDVNTYVKSGNLGLVFLTVMNIQLDQKDTQSNNAGMSHIYSMNGTYVKSFYTVLFSPSCVKIRLMGSKYPRLHHSISWGNAVPVIISENHKKQRRIKCLTGHKEM